MLQPGAEKRSIRRLGRVRQRSPRARRTAPGNGSGAAMWAVLCGLWRRASPVSHSARRSLIESIESCTARLTGKQAGK